MAFTRKIKLRKDIVKFHVCGKKKVNVVQLYFSFVWIRRYNLSLTSFIKAKTKHKGRESNDKIKPEATY